jgi:hypothetical protein
MRHGGLRARHDLAPQFPQVPRGGCEDGGLATIRRPLDVTLQVGDDCRGARPGAAPPPGQP